MTALVAGADDVLHREVFSGNLVATGLHHRDAKHDAVEVIGDSGDKVVQQSRVVALSIRNWNKPKMTDTLR